MVTARISSADFLCSFSTIDICLRISSGFAGFRRKIKQHPQRIRNPKIVESPIAAPNPELIDVSFT